MIYAFTILFYIINLNVMVIFDFEKNSSLKNWYVVNDDVMGGVSRSNISVNEDGNAVFQGTVSLENNGGFCSVRYDFENINVAAFKKASLRIKGDGKEYQFRVRADRNDYYSYVSTFKTSGDWETIEILLEDMYPVFRGRNLDMPNFSNDSISQIAFLIGNEKEETFRLEIDKIELK